MNIFICIFILVIGIIIGITINHFYLLSKFNGYKGFVIFIQNVEHFGTVFGQYSYTKPSYILNVLFNICEKCGIPRINVDATLVDRRT